MGPDGFPLSWKHYRFGMPYAARSHIRKQAAMAEAVRIGNNAPADRYEQFQADARRATVPQGFGESINGEPD